MMATYYHPPLFTPDRNPLTRNMGPDANVLGEPTGPGPELNRKKYLILVGGIDPGWNEYRLRDFIKPVTTRIWTYCEQYFVDQTRAGRVGSITVNGRADAERLLVHLRNYRYQMNGQDCTFIIHAYEEYENAKECSKVLYCNCSDLGLNYLDHREGLRFYMTYIAPTKPAASATKLIPPPPLPPPAPHMPMEYQHTYQQPIIALQMAMPYQQGMHFAQTYVPVPFQQAQEAMAHVPQAPSYMHYYPNWREPHVHIYASQPWKKFHGVHMTRLSYETNENDLKKLFLDAGIPPVSVRVHRKQNRKSKGYATVDVGTEERVALAISHFHQIRFMDRDIIVQAHRSISNPSQTYYHSGNAPSSDTTLGAFPSVPTSSKHQGGSNNRPSGTIASSPQSPLSGIPSAASSVRAFPRNPANSEAGERRDSLSSTVATDTASSAIVTACSTPPTPASPGSSVKTFPAVVNGSSGCTSIAGSPM